MKGTASSGVAQVTAPVSVRVVQMKRQLQYFIEHNMHAQATSLQKEVRIHHAYLSTLSLSLSLGLLFCL